jgi:DNA polymerase III epsilon subunit-like protein
MANNVSQTKPIAWVLNEFLKDALKAANIINHNVYFDVQMVKAETFRTFGPDSMQSESATVGLHKDKRICTMRGSKQLFNYKWPKLTQLHDHLFKKPFNAHDAMEDVLACERCYYELKKRKEI